jgi:uncharacterized protein YidB (DUF937 family)
MTDISKLSALLDDPEVRELIFGLAHVRSVVPAAEPGAARLHAVVLRLADTTDVEQYGSWLSDDVANHAMTADQVRLAFGDGAIEDLAVYVDEDPGAIGWQLAAVLPDLVDAVSPGGLVVDASVLARELADASVFDDQSAGAFGPHLH